MSAPQRGNPGVPLQGVIAQVAPTTAFVLPASIPTNQTTPWGPGVIVPVTGAANTPITVTHGLGRKVQGMKVFSNANGGIFNPRLKWGTSLAGGISTPQRVTVEGDETMTNCLIEMF